MRKLYTLLVLVLLAVYAGAQEYPAQAPLNPDFKEYLKKKADGKSTLKYSDGHALGLLPSPVKPVLRPLKSAESEDFPANYDLRNENGVTSVKDQGQCGSCWTFATLGVTESRWLMQGDGTYDLSEDNLKNCHNYDWGHCAGGNLYISAALFARGHGPMTEADDPYSETSDSTCPSGLTPAGYVTDIWWIDTNRASIKQAVTDYGALYVSYYSHGDSYNNSDNTYYYEGSGDGSDGGGGHGVVLVGWDDNKVTEAGKPGAWIIKNSWGDSWGESGYFYMSYYGSVGLNSVGVMPNRIDHNPDATIYGHDELGWTTSFGWGDGKDQALVKFTPSSDQQLQSIGTYAVASGSTLDIEIYDDFDGSTLSNQLSSLGAQTCTHTGYHTFDLSTPIDVASGNDVYVKVSYNTGTSHPVPAENVQDSYSSNAVISDPGNCWASDDGSGWFALGNGVSNGKYDVSIKAYATPSSSDGTGSGSNSGELKWLSPRPQGNNLLDQHFFDASNGLVTGEDGTILKTTDGGASWSVSQIDTLKWIHSIHFVDDNTGYLAGTDGIIYKTTDGGLSWSVLNSPTSNSIYSICFLDASNGFVADHGGDVYQTTNGGDSWSSVSHGGSGGALKEVYFVNSSVGFIVGGAGDILRTGNGGTTWSVISSPVTEQLDAVWFTDDNNGYIVGDNGVILKTTDAGMNWSLYSKSGPNYSSYNSDAIYIAFEDVYFTDANTGYATGQYSIYKTTDAGGTWTKKHGDIDLNVRSLVFPSSGNGLAFSDDGYILESSDGGESWSKLYDDERSSIYGIDFVSSSTGWTVSYDGYLQKTTDGGNSWTNQYINTYLYDLDAVDENTMIAVGTSGRILTTTDGGSNWNTPSSGVSDRLYAIDVVDQNIMYAGGEDGAFTESADGGQSWTATTISGMEDIRDVYFFSSEMGWIFGGNSGSAKMFKTTDGGGSWNEITSPVQEQINAVWFVDNSIGYVCGDNGLLMKTTDGGSTWTAQSVTIPSGFTQDDFNDIVFADENNGYVVGESGLFFKTSDGGQNWDYVKNITTSYLYDAALAGSNLIMVGRDGTIMQYGSGTSSSLAADFTADATTGDAPFTVNFTDQSTGNITSREWDFNTDGTVDSTTRNPSWEYSDEGTYTVSLTVGDGASTDKETKMDYITVTSGDVITSTTEGGNWSEASTWVDGVVPTASDNVVIDGDVIVDQNSECTNLTINSGNILRSINEGFYKELTVNGILNNSGTIQDNGDTELFIHLYGDLINNGVIDNDQLRFDGTTDQTISMSEAAIFRDGKLAGSGDSTISVIAGSDLKFIDYEINLSFSEEYTPLVLPESSGYRLELLGENGIIKGTHLNGNGNTLYMSRGAYLYQDSYLSNLLLKGTVETYAGVTFTGDSTVVIDTLQNHSGNYALTINSPLINRGIIRDTDDAGLHIQLKDDLINHGTIENEVIYFTGASDQTISMSDEAIFRNGKLGALGNSTISLIAGSDLKFIDYEINLSFSEEYTPLVLPEGSGYRLELLGENGIIKGTHLYGNGNTLYMSRGAYLYQDSYLSNLLLKGTVETYAGVTFTGDSTVVIDSLQSHSGFYNDLTVNSTLINRGIIKDNGDTELNIESTADLVNYANWENDETRLKGSVDQTIDIIDAQSIGGTVRFYAMKGTDSYQWYRDDSGMSGETGEYLSFDELDITDNGTYYCSTDAGNSRNITVTGNVTIKADFLADVTTGTAPLTVNFSDQSEGNVQTWSWDLDGDGTEDATTQNPQFTYDQAGTYSVTLTISDGSNTDEITRTDYITVEEAINCTWDFTSEPYVMNFEPSEDLTGWTYLDANEDDTTWVIYGSGGIDDTYAAGYSYTTTNAADDWIFSRCFDLEAGKKYAVSFYYAVEDSYFPEKLRLGYGTDKESSVMSEVITDLGEIDNESYMKSLDTISIASSDTYYFGWHAYSDANMWSVYIDSVKIKEMVAEPLSAEFNADEVSGHAPHTVQFTDQSTGEIASWSWDFDNDGTTDATSQNPSYTYEEPGTYTVALSINDGSSTVTETKTDFITVDEETALENIFARKNVMIYPNPAMDKITIRFSDELQFERVELTGLGGNKLSEWDESHFSQSKLWIDVSQYPDGIYLIRAYLKDKVITRKLIKH